MFVPRTGRWVEALRHTLKRVHDPTTRTPIPWYLAGEAALALQGVSVEPDAIEFRAVSPYAAAYFTNFMKPYEVPANAATIVYRRGGNMAPSESWRSNVHQRIVAWSSGGRACWLGRWYVDDIRVQVLYVRGIHVDPASMAPSVSVRRVRFEGMDVAVVPLELLLAESALRSDTHLTHRIVHAMRASGYSAEDLNTAVDVMPADKASRLLRLLEIGLVAG